MILLALVATLTLPAAAHAAKPERQLYVSLGDSYASGFQPTAAGQGANTRNGFAYQVAELAKARGYRYKLVNFGCGGATTISLLEQATATRVRSGRAAAVRRPHADRRRRALPARHRGKVGLITVSIGGNDVTMCAREADPIPCVAAAVTAINQNVGPIAQRLRKAAGRKVRIVGTTYPDVILGQWVGEGADQELAKLSVTAFKDFINPALTKAYASAAARSSTSRPPPAPTARSTSWSRSRPERSRRSRSPTSASSPTTASSATSTRARAATGSSPSWSPSRCRGDERGRLRAPRGAQGPRATIRAARARSGSRRARRRSTPHDEYPWDIRAPARRAGRARAAVRRGARRHRHRHADAAAGGRGAGAARRRRAR